MWRHGLTRLERSLFAAVKEGRQLNLGARPRLLEPDGLGGTERRRIRARVLRDLFLRAAAEGIDPRGIRIRGAYIDGDLDLEELDARVAVRLQECVFGRLVLSGATLRLLDLSGSHLSSSAGCALAGEGLMVDGPLYLGRGFRAVGAGTFGAVRLSGARVGFVDLSGGEIRNDSGPALRASRLHVEGDLYAARGFSLVGTGEDGAFRLLGGQVGGELWLVEGSMTNLTGPAFDGENVEVGGDFLYSENVFSVGAGEKGVLHLPGARIGGALLCEGRAASVDNVGAAFVADGTTVAGQVGISPLFACRADPDRWSNRSLWRPDGMVSLDGMTYPGIPSLMSVDQWVTLLRERTPAYAAQPYQQLARVWRAAGHDREARQILLSQQQDLRARVLTGPQNRLHRLWHKALGTLIGHGYQTWRAVVGLILVILLTVALTLAVGQGDGLSPVRSPAATSGHTTGHCPLIDQIGLALDLSLPLVKTGARERCQPNTTGAGQVLTGLGWMLQLTAWAFATLMVAGYTGLIRRI